MNERTKEWRKNMTEEQRELKRKRERNYSKTDIFRSHRHVYYQKLVEKFKIKIFELLGDKCKICGFSDKRALQIDHINGGGHKHRKGKNQIKLMKYVLKRPEEFQILCANCNVIKRIENKEN